MNPHSTGHQAFADAVQHVAFGPVSEFQNLSIVPLLSATERDVEYLTLDEALAGGWAQITEVSDAGQVSELKVVVNGDRPVLLVDGEELVGAKQNRILNLSLLVPGNIIATRDEAQTKRLVDAARRIKADRKPVEVHTYMPTSKAVATLDYASSVPGAWIVGVGFDLLPLVMLALLMLAFAEAREPYQPRKPYTVVGGREAA